MSTQEDIFSVEVVVEEDQKEDQDQEEEGEGEESRHTYNVQDGILIWLGCYSYR